MLGQGMSEEGQLIMRLLTTVARDIDFGIITKNPEFIRAAKYMFEKYDPKVIDVFFAEIDAERKAKRDADNQVLQGTHHA